MILCAEVELELGLLLVVNEIGVDSICESDLGLIVVGDLDAGDSLGFPVDISMGSVLWSLGFVLRIVAK